MSKSTKGLRKAGIASVAVALTLGAGIVGAGSASATADFKFDRIGGTDRYETAALVADEYGTYTEAIIANGEPGNYADALTANYLSGVKKAPILLTRKDKTPSFTLAELKENGTTTKITIVGGVGVVSAAQEQSLKDAGYAVTRVAGSDRFQTNAEVIKAGGAAKDLGIIATGFNFADALAGGPLAYNGHALGLSESDDIDNDVVSALKAAGVKRVLVLGGPTIVGPEVVAELKAAGIELEERLYGADRSATSTEVADYAISALGFSDTAVNVASGYTEGYGADALAGGPLTGMQKRPMLITRDVNNVGDLDEWMKANANTLKEGIIFGGNGAVSVAAQDQLEKAAQSETTNMDFSVNPSGDQSKPASSSPTTNEGRSAFTVTGLDDAKTYDIALFPCDNVTTNANGVTTFKDAENTDADADLEGNDVADDKGTTETGAAVIENANNGTVGAKTVNNLSPLNGTITFTVDSVEADCATAVLFEDSNAAAVGDVDLNAANEPTDLFVATGDLVWTAGAAGTGTYNGTTVTSTDEANNKFGGDTGGSAAEDTVFSYDSNDRFNLPGLSGASMAQFENALNTGDELDINYNADADGQSTFTITTNTTPAPTGVSATVTNPDRESIPNDVAITWSAGENTATGTTYSVARFTSVPNADGTCPAATTAAGTVTDTTNTDTSALDEDRTTGCYAYQVTATSPNGGTAPGGVSAMSNTVKVNAPVAPDTTPPTLSSAQPNDVNNSTGSTSQVRFNWSEAVKVLDVTKFTVEGGGLTFTGTSATISGNTVIVTINGTLEDAPSGSDVTYIARAAAGAVEDTAGNDNAAASGNFAY